MACLYAKNWPGWIVGNHAFLDARTLRLITVEAAWGASLHGRAAPARQLSQIIHNLVRAEQVGVCFSES